MYAYMPEHAHHLGEKSVKKIKKEKKKYKKRIQVLRSILSYSINPFPSPGPTLSGESMLNKDVLSTKYRHAQCSLTVHNAYT